MSVDEGMLLAPLDPKFRPDFEMFQSMCDFLVSKGLSQETFKYSFHEKFLSLERLELFPKTFNYLEPNQWTSSNLELYEDLFNFEDVFDDNDEVSLHREYYRDNAGLRG